MRPLTFVSTVSTSGTWLLAAVVAIGCGGPEKPKVKSASDLPPPPKAEEVVKREATAAEKKEFDEAVAEYKKITQEGLDPKKCGEMAKLFGDLADKYPDLTDARYNEGAVKERCKDVDGARKAYLAVLKTNGSHAPSLGAIGRLSLAAGDEARAMEYFEQAVKADPKSPYGYLGKGMVLRERGRRGDKEAVTQAVSELRKTLAVDAANMDAYGTLALLIYDHAGNDHARLDLARLVCEQAKKIDKNYAPTYNVLGLIWLKRENFTAALTQFKKAVEMDNDLLEVHLNIGAIALSFRDYVLAEESFKQALRLQPKHVDAQIGLGVALRGQRKPREAEEAYIKAGELAPDNPAVDYNLGVLYQDYLDQTPEQLNQAEKHYEKYLAKAPKGGKVEDIKSRIKTIHDNIKAIEEAKRMQAEAERMQKEMERQQKEMEERMKRGELTGEDLPPEAEEGAEGAPAEGEEQEPEKGGDQQP